MFLLLSLFFFFTIHVSCLSTNEHERSDFGTITLPSKAKLRTCLYNDDLLRYFIEKSDIVDKLAGKTLAPEGVLLKIELILVDYFKATDDLFKSPLPFMDKVMGMHRTSILECAFQDYPDELKRLNDELVNKMSTN